MAHREVIITTKIVPDQGNAARFKALANEIKKAKEQGEAGAAKTVTAAIREQQKQATSAHQAIERQRAAAQRLNQEYLRHKSTILSANLEMGEAFKSSLGGALSFGRGLAVLGVTGEKDMQKVMQALLKITATFDIMRGGIEILSGAVKMMRAYKTATEGAAAAQAALAAAQAAGGGTAGRAAAGGAAGAAGAGAAGGAGGGLAAGAVAGVAAPLAIGASVAAVLTGIIAAFSKEFRTGLGELVGLIDTEADLREDLNRKLARQDERAEAMYRQYGTQFGKEQARREVMGSNPRADLRSIRGQQQWASKNEAGLGGRLYDVRGELAQAEIDALKRIQEEERKRLEIGQKAARERVNSAMEELRLTQEVYKTELAKADAIKSQRLSAKEQFGQLDPSEQQRLIGIKRKADAQGWQSLTREERQRLGSVGLDSTREIVSKGNRAAADAAGWSGVFGQEERRAEAEARRKAEEARVKVEGGVKISSDITVKLDSDLEALSRQMGAKMAEEMEPTMTKLKQQILEAMERQIEARFARDRYNRNQQRGAPGR